MVYTVRKEKQDISILKGKVITEITGLERDSDLVIFRCNDGTNYCMWHDQDCCEDVSIEDVTGNISDLLGFPVTMAEMSQNDNHDVPLYDDDKSKTWTFYKLATIKGYVTIRWYGESNGYYSEGVDFSEIIKEEIEARGNDYAIKERGSKL